MAFVTRSQGKLLLQGKTLTFGGIHANGLTMNEEVVKGVPVWQEPSPFEQEDLIQTAAMLKSPVIRMCALRIQSQQNDALKHVVALNYGNANAQIQLNDTLMQSVDRIIYLAQRYNMRVVFVRATL